jgi:hypothetical protein
MIYRNRFNEPVLTYGQFNLLYSYRTHWREIATWTWIYLMSRFTTVSTISDEVFNRLYREPEELGNIIQTFFGYENVQKYIQGLEVQIALIKEIIDAEVAGNITLTNEKVRQLYKNTDERAKFLSSINPFWKETDLRNLYYTFHRYTLEMITAFLRGDYKTSFSIYDRLLNHADLMGSYFTQCLFYYMTYRPPGTPPLTPSSIPSSSG